MSTKVQRKKRGITDAQEQQPVCLRVQVRDCLIKKKTKAEPATRKTWIGSVAETNGKKNTDEMDMSFRTFFFSLLESNEKEKR